MKKIISVLSFVLVFVTGIVSGGILSQTASSSYSDSSDEIEAYYYDNYDQYYQMVNDFENFFMSGKFDELMSYGEGELPPGSYQDSWIDGEEIHVSSAEALFLVFCTDKYFNNDGDGSYNKIILEEDIDLSGFPWLPMPVWKWEFDGNGYSIYNMNILLDVSLYQKYAFDYGYDIFDPHILFDSYEGKFRNGIGLFGSVEGGYVHNLSISGTIMIPGSFRDAMDSMGYDYSMIESFKIGMLAGQITSSTIVEVKSGGTIVNGALYFDTYMGGLAGYVEGSDIHQVSFEGVIASPPENWLTDEYGIEMGSRNGNGYAVCGGVIGYLDGSVIDIYSKTNISLFEDSFDWVGGVIGECFGDIAFSYYVYSSEIDFGLKSSGGGGIAGFANNVICAFVDCAYTFTDEGIHFSYDSYDYQLNAYPFKSEEGGGDMYRCLIRDGLADTSNGSYYYSDIFFVNSGQSFDSNGNGVLAEADMEKATNSYLYNIDANYGDCWDFYYYFTNSTLMENGREFETIQDIINGIYLGDFLDYNYDWEYRIERWTPYFAGWIDFSIDPNEEEPPQPSIDDPPEPVEPEEYTITYNGNGGTTSTGALTRTQTVEENERFTTLSASTFTRSGYTLSNWSTSSSSVAGSYTGVSTSYIFTSNRDITLYAIWTKVTVSEYTITFDENGGSAVSDITYTTNDTKTLPSTSKTGYTFQGWKPKVTSGSWSSGQVYSAGTSVKGKTGSVTLVAQWTPYTYTVVFNKNSENATGTMSNQSFTYGVSQALRKNTFECAGCEFVGWATSASGSKVYSDGQVVRNLSTTNGGTVNLYAVWESNYKAKYDLAGDYWYIEIGSMPQTKLTDSGIIEELNNDDILDDLDGVTTSTNVYYFGGNMLAAKIYHGIEYCNFLNNWYKVEPVRWRLKDNASYKSGYANASNKLLLQDKIVSVGQYSLSMMDTTDGYISANEQFSYADYYFNNFNAEERGGLVEFSSQTEKFSSTGTTTETYTGKIVLSSEAEIKDVMGSENYAVEFSDLVKDYLNARQSVYMYYVRDLGTTYNNATCYTSGGGINQRYPTTFLGMRYTMTISSFVCE